ncbi:MAG: hypothetical protein Q4G02_01035 [bacterium]|nr:hypothetical protein [bacterium]
MTKKMAFIFLAGLLLICAGVLYWRGERQTQPTIRIVTPLPATALPIPAAETESVDATSATTEALNADVEASAETVPEASSPLELSI